MGSEREVRSGRGALHAYVRMRLAFWQAQDRRSVTNGPGWLWRGQHVAPVRLADLSVSTAELIARRRARGMAAAALFGAAGPRQTRLPRWATRCNATYWSGVGMLLILVGLVCARAAGDRARVGVFASWGAAVCAAVALVVAGLLTWSRRDPLRLSPAQLREVNSARRVLDWNPLAGVGPITAGGGYLMEGISVVSELVNSPAWTLPGVDILRWRFDPEEEIFQIARAAHCLDMHETSTTTTAQLISIPGATTAEVVVDRQHLTDALLNRLTMLHRCVVTLNDVQQRAQQASAGNVATVDKALFGAAAESELAAAALNDLNTDLLAMVDGYAAVGTYLARRTSRQC